MAVAAGLVPGAGAAVRAGAAAADITPPIGTPMFAYAARGLTNPGDTVPTLVAQLLGDPDNNFYAKTFVPSRGIHVRIKARALALERDGRRFVLAQADVGGFPLTLLQEVRRRIAHAGVQASDILLSATHTHSSTGPLWPSDNLGYAVVGGDLFDPRIFDLTAQGIAEAILTAIDRLRPARLGVGQVELRDASRNRNFEPFRLNPEGQGDEAQARRAAIDPLLTVVRADALDGTPIAAWSNFAIHPTSFGDDNLLLSGDNAGFAVRIAERDIARHAGGAVVNVWTNGNEGDISPNGGTDKLGAERLRWTPEKAAFDEAHLAGLRTARGIVRAWRAAGDHMADDVTLGGAQSFLPLDGTAADGEPVGPVPVLGSGGVVGPDGSCAPFDGFAGPGQGNKMIGLAGLGLLPNVAPLTVLRIGDLAIAGLPFEITRTMGQRIRAAVTSATSGGATQTIIAGLTNGYLSYTATPEEYDACFYEGSFTLFGRRQGPRLRDATAALAAHVFVPGAPAPDSATEPLQNDLGVAPGLSPRMTPQAGTPASQPKAEVARMGRATFAWHAGDPRIDAPRGGVLVELQRRNATGWHPFDTDDSTADIVERGSDDVWMETYQFGPCDPLGTYRFVVRGRARTAADVAAYELASDAFRLKRAVLDVSAVEVAGRRARIVVRYPDPGEEALLALPRLVRRGKVTLVAGGRRVRARTERAGPGWSARVRRGVAVRLRSASDTCGNRAPR